MRVGYFLTYRKKLPDWRDDDLAALARSYRRHHRVEQRAPGQLFQ